MTDFLRRLFFVEKIYFARTLMGLYIQALRAIMILIILLAIAYSSKYDLAMALAIGFGVFILMYFLRSIVKVIIVHQRLPKYIPKYQGKDIEILNTAISYKFDAADVIGIIEDKPKFKQYNAVFYFKDKDDDVVKEVFYTVYEGTLSRTLPHVLFDSHHAHSKQFRYLYSKSQKFSIQGNFDAHFDTYTPETYHLDALAFVTPEVMEVLIAAKDYDIEIINNKVLIFGPLASKSDIAHMQLVGEQLRIGLNDNIDTYRDNHLKGKARETEIAPYGKQLIKSPMRYVPGMIIAGSLSLVAIGLGIVYSRGFALNEFAFFAYITFIVNLFQAAKLYFKNKTLIARYENIKRYQAGS